MIEMPKSRTFLGALNGFQYTWFECDEVADTSVRLEGAMSIFMASPETYGCRIGKTGKVYCFFCRDWDTGNEQRLWNTPARSSIRRLTPFNSLV
jgi:hypothetical protein